MVSTEAVGIAYLFTGVGLLVLLRKPLQRPDKPGSAGFAIAVVGISLWPIALGVNYFVAELTPSIALWAVRLSAASLTSIGWFLVAAEVSKRLAPTRAIVPAAGYLLVELLLVVTNSTHGLVFGPGTVTEGTVLVVAYGPWFWIQTVINYGLIVVGTAFLAIEWMRSNGLRRRQTATLTVAVVPPIVANLVTHFGRVPTVHDLTPFGLIGSGVLLSWALYRAEFLDIVPVARQVAMAEMQDAVVTLDPEHRIVDCNRAARSTFDIPRTYAGNPVETYLPSLTPDALTDAAFERPDVITESVDGEPHSFSVSVSPVVEWGETVARVVVLRNITPIKRRERELEERESELDLLRQILSRVLRHNIRNKLTTIRGNADLLASADKHNGSDHVERIVDASDSLLALSEKAQTIEHLVNRAEETCTYDLPVIAERAVETVKERYPDADYSVTGAETCLVETGPGLEAAVECLVENAACHSQDSEPTVRVSIECSGDEATISVVDDGPGIPAHERTVIRRHEETPLSHSSGVGLWLVSWVADRCEADLSFDVDESGSTVSIRLPREA